MNYENQNQESAPQVLGALQRELQGWSSKLQNLSFSIVGKSFTTGSIWDPSFFSNAPYS